MDLMITDADNLQSGIISLRNSLPQVAETPPRPTQAHNLRDKRKAALTILSGVFGTLMGWFTHRHLNNLRDQIREVRDQQHRFLRIQQVTLARLDDLKQFYERSYKKWSDPKPPGPITSHWIMHASSSTFTCKSSPKLSRLLTYAGSQWIYWTVNNFGTFLTPLLARRKLSSTS